MRRMKRFAVVEVTDPEVVGFYDKFDQAVDGFSSESKIRGNQLDIVPVPDYWVGVDYDQIEDKDRSVASSLASLAGSLEKAGKFDNLPLSVRRV